MAQRCLFQHAISRLHCWLHRPSPLLSKPQKTNAIKKKKRTGQRIYKQTKIWSIPLKLGNWKSLLRWSRVHYFPEGFALLLIHIPDFSVSTTKGAESISLTPDFALKHTSCFGQCNEGEMTVCQFQVHNVRSLLSFHMSSYASGIAVRRTSSVLHTHLKLMLSHVEHSCSSNCRWKQSPQLICQSAQWLSVEPSSWAQTRLVKTQ